MTGYLLDTNILSALMEENEMALGHAARIAHGGAAYLSAISQGELLFGLLNAPPSKQAGLAERINRGIGLLAGVVPVDRAAAQAYSAIRYDLKVRGRLIPDNDLWIAATAMANDFTLVSHDDGFRHITGLKLEDWVG